MVNKVMGLINKKMVGLLVILAVVGAIVVLFLVNPPEALNDNPAVVVIRVDDVQDYAFKKAQLYLLKHSQQNNYPLSLAIIPFYFGQDSELVDEVKQSIIEGSEVSVHGWKHENLSVYDFEEQKFRLTQGKTVLRNVLGVESKVLVPPMFSYNNDTVKVMEETGFSIVSGLSEFHQNKLLSESTQSIPATVELCDFANNSWFMKSPENVFSEIKLSVKSYGYAIIVTHPQEFMVDSELNLEFVQSYEQLIKQVSEEFSFCTLQGLVKNVQLN